MESPGQPLAINREAAQREHEIIAGVSGSARRDLEEAERGYRSIGDDNAV